MKAKPSKEYDFITSLASARKFHDVGKSCLVEYKESGKISPTDVFAAATNYGLAIELYLKSLIIMEGSSKVRGHFLDELYNKLTDDTKKKVAKEYQGIGGQERKETLYIRGSLEGSKAANSNNQPTRGTKLDQVLKNNRDIFVIYRYMFEKGRSKDWEYFCFEFGNLDLVISALANTANGFLSLSQVRKSNIT